MILFCHLCECLNNIVGSANNVVSLLECQLQCQQNSLCTYFSFSGGVCYFKNFTLTKKFLDSSTYGPKSCEGNTHIYDENIKQERGAKQLPHQIPTLLYRYWFIFAIQDKLFKNHRPTQILPCVSGIVA